MQPISYARHQFSPEVIRQAIWLYLRFTLSYRDVEELLADRGLGVSYETIRRWVLKFGPGFARNPRRLRPRPTGTWHLDEMVVSIQGRRVHLWRAVDSEGEVLDVLVQPRRDKAAALKLMRKLLRKQGFAPGVHSVVLELRYPRHRICGRRPTGPLSSVLVLFRQELWLQNTPSALTNLSFQTLNLPKKLRCQPQFALKAFITGIAAQAQLHVTDSCFESALENA
jgi:putative transposase